MDRQDPEQRIAELDLIDVIPSALIALALGVGFIGVTLIRRRSGKSW